jgi:TRAP-type C4-dicarboxylate transport system permease small subunit
MGRVGSLATRGFERLMELALLLCELLVVGMVALVAAEVAAREVLGFSLEFPYEVSGYLLVAVTFLGLGISLHEDGLFRVEFLYARLSPRIRRQLQLAYDVLCLAFGVVLDYHLIGLVMSSYRRGYVEATSLATPLYIPQIAMPIGVTLMLVVLSARIAGGLKDVSGRPRRAGQEGKA